MGVRTEIDKYCRLYLPASTDLNSLCHWHQMGFDNIAKDYGQGSGTTCGFLPHWLLWRTGCSDTSVVNRSVPEKSFIFRMQQNLSIFAKHKARVRVNGALATQMANGTGGPQPGDFIIIRGDFWKNPDTGVRDRDSAHIFVLLKVVKADGKQVEWEVAQTGVTNNAGEQCGQIVKLAGKLKDGQMKEAGQDVDGPHLVFVANIKNEEPNFPRRVSSYVNVEAIPGGAMPDGITTLLDTRRIEKTRNDPKTVYPVLGWYEQSNPGGFIIGPSYIVLERGHETARFTKQGLGDACQLAQTGIWTRMGDRTEIQWREGKRQSWDLKKIWSPKEAVIGTPVEGDGGTLKGLGKNKPDAVPAKWASANLGP